MKAVTFLSPAGVAGPHQELWEKEGWACHLARVGDMSVTLWRCLQGWSLGSG